MQNSDVLTFFGIVIALGAYISAARIYLHEQLKKPAGVDPGRITPARSKSCPHRAAVQENDWDRYWRHRMSTAWLSAIDIPLLLSGWSFLVYLLIDEWPAICSSLCLTIAVICFLTAAVAITVAHFKAFCKAIETIAEARERTANSPPTLNAEGMESVSK